MPPRYAYWTILVDELPTAFRAATLEDIQPTFARLKTKNPTARLVWFQNGKVWNSRLEAQEAMRERGDRGRMGDFRQRPPRRDSGAPPESEGGPVHRSALARRSALAHRSAKREGGEREGGKREGGEREGGKLEWRPKSSESAPSRPPDLKTSRPQGLRPSRPQGLRASEKLPWRPKGAGSGERSGSRPDWKPKPKFGERRSRDDRKPRSPAGASREKLEWRPKGAAPAEWREKRKWVPKEEYKKSKGIEAKRDKNWRPGGEHKDPRQKYKDAKKAKWGRFKQNIRKRWESKSGSPTVARHAKAGKKGRG